MNVWKHLIVSLAISVISLAFDQEALYLAVYVFGFNITVLLLCLIFGVLLDIDHLVDYRINRWHMSESLESRFRSGRMYVVLHGFENIAILAALTMVFPFLAFPTASYACHLAMDALGNGVSFQAYSYAVRIRKTLVRGSSGIH